MPRAEPYPLGHGTVQVLPMEAILVTQRGNGTGHWSLQLGTALAAALRDAGHRVRWLRAVHEGAAAPPAPEGVECADIVGNSGSFRRVHARVTDTACDVALTRMLRERPAQQLLHLGYGSAGSVNTLWIATRMGTNCRAVVRAAEVLCHRATLVDEAGRTCAAWEDVQRCTACCLTTGLLGRFESGLGRLARGLGGLSPWPNPDAFRNRLELSVGNLQLADRVVVADAAEAAALRTAGIAEGAIRLLPLPGPESGPALATALVS